MLRPANRLSPSHTAGKKMRSNWGVSWPWPARWPGGIFRGLVAVFLFGKGNYIRRGREMSWLSYFLVKLFLGSFLGRNLG